MKNEVPQICSDGNAPAGSPRRFDLPLTTLLVITLYCLISCANPIPPTGGPKDETPPQLDTSLSTRNRQVHFEKKDIVLTFDEWVELRDAFNQVVISPPLEFRHTIERKKKSIVLHFDEKEELRDSATYVINFGEAIRDLTEGNVAPVVFVFSTGDYIDSLSVDGHVVDAFTGEPVKDVLFMVYENLADSVFRTERPFYFARTDDGGKFKVSNMKPGTFKAVALVDQNLNYRYDNEVEKVAFLDSAIVLKGFEKTEIDTIVPIRDSLLTDSASVDSLKLIGQATTIKRKEPLALKLFEAQKQLFLRDKDADTYGKVHLGFNREPYDAIVEYDSIGQFTFLEKEVDTLRLWYNIEDETPFNVYVKRDTFIDTIEVVSGLKESFLETSKLSPASKAPAKMPVIAPASEFGWAFNHPIYSFDNAQIKVFEDSLKTGVDAKIQIDPVQQRQLLIGADWGEDIRYKMEIGPGGVTDIYGLTNEDTLKVLWKSGLVKDYGSLTLRVENLLPDTSYVIRLLAKSGALFKEFPVTADSVFEVKLAYILPDVYSIEIIEDLDSNQRWTTGDYDLKRQPERVHRATLEEVRANWEVDAKVKFDPTSKPAAARPPSTDPQPSGGRGRQ